MNMVIEVQGVGESLARMNMLNVEGVAAVAEGMTEWAEETMGESKEVYCPVRNIGGGTLRASGHVQPPVATATTITVVLGYGGPAAPYALKVHENPRSGKTGGIGPQGQKYTSWAEVGQWKYLETPVKKNAPRALQTIMKWVMRAINRITR